MKNIQVVDGAGNCTFPIFQATDDEFTIIFPAPGQDIQFAEDLDEHAHETLIPVWERPIAKGGRNGHPWNLVLRLREEAPPLPGHQA